MSIKSVQEILKLSDSHSNPNQISYRHLVKQLDSQIRERALRHSNLSFRTPSILFGKPAFDKINVEKKLIKHYKKIGFTCYKDIDGDINIRWKDEEPDEDGANYVSDETSESEEETFSSMEFKNEEEEGSSSSSGSDDEEGSRKTIVVDTASVGKRVSNIGK